VSTARINRVAPRRAGLAVIAGFAAIAIAGCAGGGGNGGNGGGGGGGGGEEAATFDYLAQNENEVIRNAIATLGENECAAAEEAMPLEVETLPQADVNQRVVLLASQNALPEMFVGSTSELRPGGALGDDEITLNLEETLTELGVIDNILPAAISTVKNIYGDRFVSMPYQFNIEGFFYDKAKFEELGLEEPQTWGEFLEVVEALDAAGTQPLSASGAESWTLLRYVGNYLFRSIGPDAINDVVAGEAKLTDPEYVEGIAEVAKLAPYFSEGLATMDMQTAVSELLTGEAGMVYNGSWMLADVNNEELNQLGADGIGFMPFPAVEGGAGDINQYPANAGAPTAFSAELYNEGVGEWLSCITEYYGSSVMNEQGVISGFALNQPIEGEVPPLTTEIQETIAEVDETVTWFEASFGQRGAQAAGENAVPLFTGQMSPEDFASTVQSAVEADQ
jgi:raffinose/stachyose/melibiose transport system substrate-binding protein